MTVPHKKTIHSKPKNIVFFTEKINAKSGGMEIHANNFIQYFTDHKQYPIHSIITKSESGKDIIITEKGQQLLSIDNLKQSPHSDIVFFNSGHWIESFEILRNKLPCATFIYRTGGNEIIKAPLTNLQILEHTKRQMYWAKQINNNIDILITNSDYTEHRLINLGISTPFIKIVGGVNQKTQNKIHRSRYNNKITLFCAARFVHYKNHELLVNITSQLLERGYQLQLRLAGNGPLFNTIKSTIQQKNLGHAIKLLGELSNDETCLEICHADFYIQLSQDIPREVEGGSYIHSEGMGRSIFEAISAGTFVIAGNCGALPEIITPSNGILLDFSTPNIMTNVITTILDKHPIRLNPTTKYSWKTVCQNYEILFEQIWSNNVNTSNH